MKKSLIVLLTLVFVMTVVGFANAAYPCPECDSRLVESKIGESGNYYDIIDCQHGHEGGYDKVIYHYDEYQYKCTSCSWTSGYMSSLDRLHVTGTICYGS